MIKVILKDLFFFVKKPNDQQINLTFIGKIKLIGILILLEILIFALVVFPISLVFELISPIKTDRYDYSNTVSSLLISLVFIIPLAEEIIFRYNLRYQGFKKKIFTRTTWDSIFPYLVYIFSISFGLIHVTNFINEDLLFLIFSPIIVISQLTGGFIISFIRVRINFFWGILYHWIWNFLFVIAIPFLMYQVSKPYVEKTKNHTISIEEKPFMDAEKVRLFKIDSTENKITNMKIQQYSLQHLLDTLYQKDHYYVDDVLINLNFNSKNGASKEELLKLMRKKYKIKEYK